MKKILFGFLTGLLFISTSWAIDAFVGGVRDQDDQPLADVTIASLDGAYVITTDAFGEFKLKDYHLWNDSTELEVSYPGCESRKLKLGEMNNKLTILQCGQEIEGIVVTGCQPDLNNGIKEKTMIDGVCYPSKCVEPRWNLIGSGTAAQCVLDCSITVADQYNGIAAKQAIGNECYPSMCNSPRWRIENAGTTDAKCIDQIGDRCVFQNAAGGFWDRVSMTEYAMRDNKFRCVVTGCKSKDYKPNAEETDCVRVSGVCTPEDAHAIGDGMLKDGVCVIKECDTGWKVDKKRNECITRDGDPCTKEEYTKVSKYATSGTYKFENSKETCINLTCDENKGYKTNEDKTGCIQKLTECTSEQKAAIPNAKSWGIEKGTENCIAQECNCGYILENGRCRAREENEKKCSKYTKPQLPKNALNATMQCLNGLDGEEVCVIDDNGCADDYDLDKAKNECVKRKGQSCLDELVNNQNRDITKIKTAKWEKVGGALKCVVKECYSKDYKPNDTKTHCVQVSGACTTDDPHADSTKKGTLKKGECIPNACEARYAVKDGVCTLTGCQCGYIKNGNECEKRTEKECNSSTSPAAPANAIKGVFECLNGPEGAEICKIRNNEDCAAGYYADLVKNLCLSYDGVSCNDDSSKPTDEHAVAWQWVVSDDAGNKGCRIVQCETDWEPRDNGTKCVKVSGDCTDEQKAKIPNIKAGEIRDGKCYVTECDSNFSPNRVGTACEHNPCPCGKKLNENKTECVEKSEEEKKCTIKNAKTAQYGCVDGKEVCRVVECKDEFTKSDDDKRCTSQKNNTCRFEGENKEHVKTARYREHNGKLECVITACLDGWMVDEENNVCIDKEGPCSDAQVKQIPGATAGELKKGKCYPTQCEAGYEPYKTQCVEISGNCDEGNLPKNATMGERRFDKRENREYCYVTGCVGGYDPSKDGKTCEVNAEEQKKIAEAQAKYDLARENEQSLENRLLGATGIGTMGVGGKMVGQALAEQAADEDAELDMAAYLASFRCDYGGGRIIRGAEMNVELPGGNELIPLYSEYVALANDLKLRKTQLGLKAGIESEKILDSATSGLYDDVSTGITKGTYASLARALMNPNGEDAKLWAEQKEKTSKNLTTGATVAGAGALISVAGNIAHTNAYQKKLKSIDVSQPLAALEKSINSHSGQEKQECPSTAPGTYPNCNCREKAEFNLNSGKCDKCPGDQTAHNGKCGCFEFGKPRWDAASKRCVSVQRDCVPECAEPTPSNHLFIDANCNCRCVGDYLYINKQCWPKSLQAPNGPDLITTLNQLMRPGTALTVPGAIKALQVVSSDDKQIQSVELSAKGLFNTGSYELTNKAQNAINTFVNSLKNEVGDNYTGVCDFTVNGYTDTSGEPEYNLTLSKQRANAVWGYLENMLRDKGISHRGSADGYGEDGCVCVPGQLSGVCKGKNPDTPVADGAHYEPCRKVTISVSCSTSVSGEVGQ